MTKWNPSAICEMMNKRFAGKMGDNKDGFEVSGNEIIIYDIDRGPRTDHGGMDGEGWMCPTEINNAMKPFLAKYMGRIKIMERDLKDDKYSGDVTMDYGEKGHISLHISPKRKADKKPAVKRNPPKKRKPYDPGADSKVAPKKDTRKKIELPKVLNQTDYIRACIKAGKSHDTMISGLAIAFDKKETWAKSRLATYEKAYGNMGITDPKLAK